MAFEWLIAALALLLALSLQPWRMLQRHSALNTPLFVFAFLLPLIWATPYLGKSSAIAPHWSGACLVLLMLGWPLAIVLFALSALVVSFATPVDADTAAQVLFWQGILPATLALLPGWLVRRMAARNLFFYTLGRAFIGTVLSLFAAYALAQWQGFELLKLRDSHAATIGLWLMAWGDGIVTGMLTAIFVAFKPEWLATWSDDIYLLREKKP